MGYYTFVCEFIPPIMSNMIVTASSTTVRINDQTSKQIPATISADSYIKSTIHFQKTRNLTPQFIFLNLIGDILNSRRGRLIVYGVGNYIPNVNEGVFDVFYYIVGTDLTYNANILRATWT